MEPIFAYPLQPWSSVKDPRRDGAGFLDPAYLRAIGDEHPGADYNLVTGGDSDLGKPVYSMFPGTVVEVQSYPTWGLNVLIRADEWVRKLVEESFKREVKQLEVLYAHLLHSEVKNGQAVSAGQCIGSIGKGDPKARMLAHLHLEVRTESRPAGEWYRGTSGRKVYETTRLDPDLLMKRLQFSDATNLQPKGRKLVVAKSVLINGNQVGTDGKAIINLDGDKAFIRVE